MQIQTNTSDQSPVQNQPVIADDVSFSDYEKIRRGEVVESKSAPDASAPEQNKPSESDTDESEEQEIKDESEDQESVEDEGSKESESEKPKKKGGFQRRIDKLNAAKTAAQREAEYWKELALKAGKSDEKPKVESRPAAVEGKPDPDQFDTHAEYVEALADWKTEQKLMERDQKLERSKLEIEQANLMKAHSERVNSFSEKHEDFFETLENVDDIVVSPAISELFLSSENGPALMYELAKNRNEFERINKLSPLAAAREIGKIEFRLSKSSEERRTETKKLTQAPKPIEPVGAGRASVAKSIDDPNLTFSEYERIRREQMKRR